MKVYAQKITNTIIDTENFSGVDFLNRALRAIIGWMFLIGIIYFLFNLFLGAFKFISSQGNPDKVKEARGQLTNAVIGLVILFAVFAILKLVGQVFGIQNLENLIITLPKL